MLRVRGRCLLVGVDAGSREAIAPLEDDHHFEMLSVGSSLFDQIEHWDSKFRDATPKGIVLGTSDSLRGKKIETAARLAAARVNVPIAIIEDYPGNYFEVAGATTSLLVVESAAAEELHRMRFGNDCPPIAVFCSPRYDRYRRKLDCLRAKTAASWQRKAKALGILWAGQPDSKDCLETLSRMAPAMRESGATLLFKAHPRDALYEQGLYSGFLDRFGIRYIDVSGLTITESLDLAPRLVLTQFSSVAVEAGFWGIPAVHVLYRDVGGRRLLQKKNYEVPVHCLQGAGLVLQVPGCEQAVLEEALFNPGLREATISRFDGYFAARANMTPLLANYLMKWMGLA